MTIHLHSISSRSKRSPKSDLDNIASIRGDLMDAAVRYVRDAKDGCRADRLRTASEASGIPINLIDVAAR